MFMLGYKKCMCNETLHAFITSNISARLNDWLSRALHLRNSLKIIRPTNLASPCVLIVLYKSRLLSMLLIHLLQGNMDTLGEVDLRLFMFWQHEHDLPQLLKEML